MRTKFSGILTLLLAFVVQITFAQEKTVTGTVTDGDGLPLPGVNIIIQGTSSGTQTDFDGNYSVEVSNGDVLEFSYVGFETQDVTIGEQSSYNVSLEAGNQLEEVIVTAAGIEREKSSIGAATTTIQADEIVKGAQSDIANSLKGKVAGVTISNASTDPGASSGVIIRGISTLSQNNQPLYVIDGVPIYNKSAEDNSLNGGYDFGRGSQDINPSDIENITILKGASATALYGNRGANGVIVITTKKGKAGKLTVDLSTTTFFSRINRAPNRQETFGQGWDGVHYLGENGSWGPKFDGKTRVWGNIVNNSQELKPYSFQEDQMRNFFETGTSYLNTVAVSGGNEKSTARMSYSNLSQDGIYPTDADSFERNTLSLSADSKVGFINFSGNLNYVNTSGSNVATGQGLTVYNNILQTPTDIDISGFEDYNDPFNNVSNYFTPYGVTNPYFSLNENGSKYNKDRVYGSFTLNLDVNSWSNLTYRFGLDTYSTQLRQWEAIVDPTPGSPNDGSTEYPGSYLERTQSFKQLNHDILYDLNLDINENIGVVSTSGFNINIRERNFLVAEVGSQNIPGFYSLSNSGQQPQASSYRSTRKLYGIFNTTTFDLKNQLFLTGNIRNDWYSTLPLDNNSSLYGGVNTSWVFTRTFDGLTSFMNYGKLRAGYGSTGVDTDPYLVNSVFVSGSTDNQGFASLNFPLGGVNAYEVGNRAANSNLKPETRKEFEVGAELEFFSNRLGIDFTYYDSKVENQILALPFAPSTGYTSQQANVGTISNTGIEALVTITPIKTSNFTWKASINFATNNSELEELDDRIDQVQLGGLSTTSFLAREGQTIGLIEGSVPARTDSGQIIVDSNGVPIAASEKEVYGDTQYDYTLGFSNNFTYKNLSLDFTLDSRQGGLMYSRTASNMRFTGNSTVTMYNDRRPFVVPNSVQQVVNNDGSITYAENTTPVDKAHQDDYYGRAEALNRGHVIDKSFVKLREVVISYSLPSKLLDKTFIDALSFSVIGRNLFIWTPEDNQFIDPEVSTFGTDLSSQFGEFGANPSTRSVGFSIKTKF